MAAAAYFVDSSALVKRYVQETGTSWVRRLTRRSPSTVIYIARITAVEVASAVARRRKDRTLTSKKASSIFHRSGCEGEILEPRSGRNGDAGERKGLKLALHGVRM